MAYMRMQVEYFVMHLNLGVCRASAKKITEVRNVAKLIEATV